MNDNWDEIYKNAVLMAKIWNSLKDKNVERSLYDLCAAEVGKLPKGQSIRLVIAYVSEEETRR